MSRRYAALVVCHPDGVKEAARECRGATPASEENGLKKRHAVTLAIEDNFDHTTPK